MEKKRQFWLFMIMIMLVFSGCTGKMNSQPQEDKTTFSSDTVDATAAEDYALRMTILDTGKSDCIIMEAGDTVVINDTADADDAAEICAFLDERQVERIEYLILSHFDKDHIGSAAVLVSEYEVGCVLMPAHEEDSEVYLTLMQAIAKTGTEQQRLTKDYEFVLEDIAFCVDAPDEDSYENDNNYSLITTVTCGETRFLLMGDALKKRTSEFLDSDAGEERYNLIKMPHHGDYNKKLSELFALARPEYVVLTAGKERARVEEKTVELMERSGCQIFYTDEGTVTALSDGRTVTMIQ